MTRKITLLLSSGIFPWWGITKFRSYIRDINFDGLELLPSRKIVLDCQKIISTSGHTPTMDLSFVKSLHQSWRLDIGKDQSYGIGKASSALYTALRYIFFPSIHASTSVLSHLSKTHALPVTVHNLEDNWTKSVDGSEFKGGILYEILDRDDENPNSLREWLKMRNHSLVLDTRDDQSLAFAKKHGYTSWKSFWKSFPLNKITNVQLTLIGSKGMKRILDHQKTLTEQELLWLYSKKWKGTITIEVNPVTLFWVTGGKIKHGLREIAVFVRSIVDEGKQWS